MDDFCFSHIFIILAKFLQTIRETARLHQSFQSLWLSVLLDPLGGGCLPCIVVALPLLSNAHLLSVLCIRRLHDGENSLDDELCVKGGHPVCVNGLSANLTRVCLYARVVDLRNELDLGWLEGIVVCEVQVDGVSSANEGSSLGAIDVNVPNHHVVLSGLNRDTWDRCTC